MTASAGREPERGEAVDLKQRSTENVENNSRLENYELLGTVEPEKKKQKKRQKSNRRNARPRTTIAPKLMNTFLHKIN